MSRQFLVPLATAAVLLSVAAFAGDKQTPSSQEKMTPQTKMLVMRDLTAERVFARKPFPLGRQGLEIKNGKLTLSDQGIARLVGENGMAAKPGDRVVISNVVIREKSIIFEINGGPKKHEKWYQHIQMGANGSMSSVGGPPPSAAAMGSMVTLAFDEYVPEMTGEQVRDLLSPVFDFKALTVAEAYEKTLPPKVQAAIKNHQVLVGMDRDMVIYAKGRPPQKIRDKDEKGQDYEEWIYGMPPEEVDFVRFQGEVVTRLEIMSVDGQKIVRTKPEVDLTSAEGTEVAKKKAPEKPANAPTLRRPGEQPEFPTTGTQTSTPPAYPPPPDMPPTTTPDGQPPHWATS